MTDVLLRIPAHEPVVLRGSAADDEVIGTIAATEHYEPHVMLALDRLLARDAVCIDGGANVGALALAMARCAPDGCVHAFEPGAANLAHLRANIRANAPAPVSVEPFGLWSSTATLRLHSVADHPGGAFIAARGDAFTTSEPVTVVALDDWMELRRIDRVDLLKLDVEGAELEALRGAARMIERFEPVVVVECNPIALGRVGGHRALHDALRRLLPHLSYVLPNGELQRILGRRHLDRLLRRRGLVDLVASPVRVDRGLRSAVREVVALLVRHNVVRSSGPAFVTRWRYRMRADVGALSLRAGERTTVPVRLRNTSGTWWRSDDATHPVMAAYHWVDDIGRVVDRNGHRTELPKPVGPWRRAHVDLDVQAPTTPGRYTLVVSLVQERFAWADELDPSLGLRVPAEVVAS